MKRVHHIKPEADIYEDLKSYAQFHGITFLHTSRLPVSKSGYSGAGTGA